MCSLALRDQRVSSALHEKGKNISPRDPTLAVQEIQTLLNSPLLSGFCLSVFCFVKVGGFVLISIVSARHRLDAMGGDLPFYFFLCAAVKIDTSH